MGAEGFRVEDPKEVKGVVDAALKSGTPVVIDALKMPVRHLAKYAHLGGQVIVFFTACGEKLSMVTLSHDHPGFKQRQFFVKI